MKKLVLLLFTGIILLIVPLRALAHGSEEHASETAVNYWSYGLIISFLLLAIFLTLFITAKTKMKYMNLKNKSNREKHTAMRKRNSLYKWGSILASVVVVFFLIAVNVNGEDKVTFTHIHGLGYTSDGEELFVPAHDGLRVYKDGSWTTPTEGAKHDYMGFNMFKDGFYSSGHPAPNSDLANPLGIVRSTDKGKTIEKLDLYGEIDFHGMTVGYDTEEIYVFNPSENSRMSQPGFYYSTDKTKSWKQAELAGLEGQAGTLAAHPTKKGVVAIGTDQGVFLSENHGNQFEKLSVSGAVSAVSFGHKNNLLVATKTDKMNLFQINLSTNETVELNVPDLGEDAITYFKQNPVNSNEFVFATNNRDIYMSSDKGNTWNQRVDEGVAISH
ncbi:hypothetical protein CFK37_03695 [Virgibacillus phasianinus]|uniref:Glycosyl hydrolase n=1 Tax=Virgibacillus phasianinus TaxID=2017483 RepID=A0A220TZR9_9BACI|nr:hypothetical protein [Virgibacillus phasianinus]ASK61338.1 hypothetical protein CFK37_03695 [Virgibacillus phasianinus]